MFQASVVPRVGGVEGQRAIINHYSPQGRSWPAQHQSGGDEIKAVIAAPSSGTSRYHPHCIGLAGNQQPTRQTLALRQKWDSGALRPRLYQGQ